MAVVTVDIEDFEDWLAEQPVNTEYTPYEVEVTGLISENHVQMLNTICKNSSPIKYIDLSATEISSGITDLSFAFQGGSWLIKTPVIPNGVTNMESCFSACYSLRSVTNLPDSITSMAGCFLNCQDLSSISHLPANVTNLSQAFSNCNKLIDIPDIPQGVTNLSETFYYCRELVIPPAIPSSVTNMYRTFIGCESLVKAPIIPVGVTNMMQTFSDCNRLTNAPVVPNGVTDVTLCFAYCFSLLYKPVLPSSVTTSTNCFKEVTQTACGVLDTDFDTWLSQQATDFEVVEIEKDTANNCYEPTGKKVYGVDISNLSTLLSGMDANTADNPYVVKILGLTSSNLGDIRAAIIPNATKYIDLRYTVLPSVSSLYNVGSHGYGCFEGCTTLVYSPNIPSSVTNMRRTFINCSSLKEIPALPSNVTNIAECFGGCISIITPPIIPSTVTAIYYAFENCKNLESMPVIPSAVTDMDRTFSGCTALKNVQSIPESVDVLTSTFYGCKSLITAPVILSNVQNVYMHSCFGGCKNLVSVPVIPAGVVGAVGAFNGCTSLKKIDNFQIPLAILKNNSLFQNMFSGCTALESIGYVINESEWHVWRLKYDSNTVEGKIFSRDGSYVSIPQTFITKSDLQLPILTDELWFPVEDDTATDTLIGKMLINKYGVFKKETIPPDEKTMVLWADNKDHFKTNLDIQPIDEVTLNNMQSVTSNAVFKNCLQVEKVTGTTLVGGGTYTIQKVGKVVTLDITGMNISSSVASNQVVVQLPERFIPNVTFSTVGFCGNGSLYFSATLGFQIYGKTATSVKGNVVVYPYMDLDVYLPQLHAVWIVD